MKKKRKINNLTPSYKAMECSKCGRIVEKVGYDAKSVTCNNCFMGIMVKRFPESATFATKSYKPTGRPAGWHWMLEFVDKDGNVFHSGKEVPKLKGTLSPTKIKKPTKKAKRRSKNQILIDRYKDKKKALKKAVKKQQDFINHNVKK